MTNFDVAASLDQLERLGIVVSAGGNNVKISKDFEARCKSSSAKLMDKPSYTAKLFEEYPDPYKAYKQLSSHVDIIEIMNSMGGKDCNQDEVGGMAAVLMTMRNW